ncbi:hypothetical protein [Ohtaekwangia sp.]|uniref:hypothetical protein n=1 Tax=Ohtaekwangia sp. TaxID=2066019 RepID=UPI002FDD44E1
MKTAKLVSIVLVMGLALSILFTACETNQDVKSEDTILPEKFSVDIPASISNSSAGGRLAAGRAEGDTVKGSDIYINLRTFIAVGKAASTLVEQFIAGIRLYKIDRVMSITYVGDDDNRVKNLVVLSNVSFEGVDWDYQLTITDAESENAADGGKALQIFWNKSSKVKGIAIIKPYNCDRITNANAKDAVFRIDYSEFGEHGYDAEMEVRIAGLPLANPLKDPYSINSLHMFAGKKGDVVDVYGNSNHPNAVLLSGTTGFDWAFVASGSDPDNIGVAEVGLPPSTLDSDDRQVLLKEYSIKNVLTSEITAMWPGIDQNALAAYLSTTSAPGYFNANGFVSGGTSPGAKWDVLAKRLDALSPYNPKATGELTISFK